MKKINKLLALINKRYNYFENFLIGKIMKFYVKSFSRQLQKNATFSNQLISAQKTATFGNQSVLAQRIAAFDNQ